MFVLSRSVVLVSVMWLFSSVMWFQACDCRIVDPASFDDVNRIAADFDRLLDKLEVIVHDDDTIFSKTNTESKNIMNLCHRLLERVHNRTNELQQHLGQAHNTLNLSNSAAKHNNNEIHENVADVVLQFLGLMGLMALFGRFSYICLCGLFVPSLAFVCDFFREVPEVLTSALVFPYLIIAFEIVGFSVFFFGQTEQSSSYFIMTSLLTLCETIITNSSVLRYCGMLILVISIFGILNQSAMTKRIFYE